MAREVEGSQIIVSMTAWCLCSVGMTIFNKKAVRYFPAESTLLVLQMAFSCVVLLVFTRKSLHFGSKQDVLRWLLVVPFFSGMLQTSMLALEYAPMALVIILRCLEPVAALMLERHFPVPFQVSWGLIGSMFIMLSGAALLVSRIPHHDLSGFGWAILSSFFAVADRSLQRLMLAADQCPVDISKTGVMLLNNFFGIFPTLICALLTQEWKEFPADWTVPSVAWILASCIVSVGISYTTISCQSLISATSFLMLLNVSKFAIMGFEASVLESYYFTWAQVLGSLLAIFGGVSYAKALESLQLEQRLEKEALVGPRKV